MTSSYFPGRNPLNYQGTNVTNPPQQYTFDRAPTSYDWETFNIGDEWRDTSQTPNMWYKLCSKARQPPPANINDRAVWRPITSVGTSDLSSLTGNSGGVIFPDSTGTINVLGTTGQISVAGSGNTLTLSLTGGGTAIDSFQPDTGTNPVVPTAAGLVQLSGSGSIQSVGGTNQLTYQLTGLTDHNVLVGAGTTTITKVAPSATAGVPLVSQGAAADPSFSTALIVGGGTGAVSFPNVNSVILSGATSTTALQSIVSGVSGTVLTSNGPGVAPSWTAGDIVQIQKLVYQTSATINGGFPADNTIPQQSEGAEIFTLSITPTNASNILAIESVITYGNDGASASFVNALFQDATADALACAFISNGANEFSQVVLRYSMVAGTTSATTFKIRGGNAGAALNYFINSTSGGNLFGGTLTSYLQIVEYPP